MNSHIKNYLDSYVIFDNPQYAVMIKGDWGSGKTHFIKEYIKEFNEENTEAPQVFIYVSIFGLKKTSSIDELIFQQLHPVLASKSAKLVGGFLKSAVKLGLKYDLDLNKNEKNEGDVSINLEKLDPINFMKDKDLPNKVFVFDDFERSMIDMSELLGYINSMVEQSALKVIIIANEKEIDRDCIYNKFKEKVINKSFVLKSDIDGFFMDYVSSGISVGKYSDLIRRLFDAVEMRNYRVLMQCIENYKYFIKEIDKSYLDNEDFASILIEHFIMRSLIYKHNLGEEKIKSLKEQARGQYTLFQEKVWKSIVEDFDFNKEDINSSISKLHFFQEEKKEESWRILWNYSIVSYDVFYENLSDVIDKYKNLYYKNPVILLHVVELLILFIEKGIEKYISAEEVEDIAGNYILKYSRNNEEWLSSEGISDFFNFTGLGFINQENTTVIEIRRKINLSLKNNNKRKEEEKKHSDAKKLMKGLESGRREDVLSIFSNYETMPILNFLDTDVFFDLLIADNPRIIFEVSSSFSHRYSENRYLNSRPYFYYLTTEVDFLVKLKKRIVDYKENSEASAFISLKLDLLKSVLNNSIERLESCQ